MYINSNSYSTFNEELSPSHVAQSKPINTIIANANRLTQFRQSPLYQMMVGNDIHLEEVKIIEQLATGYGCNVYSKDGQRIINLSVKSIPSGSNRRGGQITIEVHDCYDERLSSSVDIRHISDVFTGNQIFPNPSQTMKTNCFSLRCKNQMNVHICMISQEIRDLWIKGIRLIYQCLGKFRKVAISTRIPDNVTIPRALYDDLVTHVQQMNMKFAQINQLINHSNVN
jgi:hypothetical protein